MATIPADVFGALRTLIAKSGANVPLSATHLLASEGLGAGTGAGVGAGVGFVAVTPDMAEPDKASMNSFAITSMSFR